MDLSRLASLDEAIEQAQGTADMEVGGEMNKSEFELYMWTDSEGKVKVSPSLPRMGYKWRRGAYLYEDGEPFWLEIEQEVMREPKDNVFTPRDAVWVLKCTIQKRLAPQVGTEWVEK